MSSGGNFGKNRSFSTRQTSDQIQALPHALGPWESSIISLKLGQKLDSMLGVWSAKPCSYVYM